ncbi:MAG TPA: hypothetical protein PKU95_04690 [Candidatus Dojkabacteria bacterium]|jgi:hypothetical protein|nr:hypothetical protein [Candidatus Dojkabacteria bacterium]
MSLTIDDLIKLLLAFSVAFSLVGISVQSMRILGELVETVRESNFIIRTARELFDKFTGDYDYIIEQVKGILESIRGFTSGVFGPLTSMFSFLKTFSGKKGKEE